MLRRPLEPPRDLDGLPVADPLEERVARIVVRIATAWFVLAAAWEMFGPLLAGHYASSASMGIIAENMLRWHIPGPVWEYTRTRPGPEMYYCHHPWGIFWTTAALMKLLGRHDYLCRLAPVLFSAATPPLLYAIGRAIWRPAAGAVAAAAFVVLPITLAFAHFNALEVPVIAWSLLGLWGFVRLTQTGRRRHLVAALGGMLLALHADWPGFMLAGAMLGFGLLRGFVARDLFGPIRHERRYAAWWVGSATLAVVTLLLYLLLFKHSNKLGDLFGSYDQRAAGNGGSLASVLAARRYWIELSFTPIAIFLGKVAAVICVLRLLVLRREHEVIPLAVLAMATAQYVVFKQGADIHVFWPHYFGAYFALAMGALVATLAPLFARITALRSRAPIVALGVGLVPLFAILRDAVPALRYARETGGRFNEKGLVIDSDGDKAAFLRHLDPVLPKTAVIGMHEGMKATWSQVWTLGGRLIAANKPAPSRTRGHGSIYLADTRYMLSEVQGQLARDYHVTAVGPLWMIDENTPSAPIDASSFVEREPSLAEWYFISGTEPHRDVASDPFLTWELRTHFGQPADPPSVEPVTLEQKRIAHNIAVATGNPARAAALRGEIEQALTRVNAAYDDGTKLIGTTFHEGARSLLTIWIEAGGPTQADVQLTVRSKVTARAPWSLTLADPTDREVGLPLAIAPQRWKKGFLYADPVSIRKRPGTEVFRASFWVRGPGTAPKRVGPGGPAVEVLTLR
ncbi:Dolichyl-phosphate-mannose-protein mannosyltransferase [Minicystis rosea]|nr:Dolichyl-phosphate-mannose-protein mannosyltransferase [Minicystis rosea]